MLGLLRLLTNQKVMGDSPVTLIAVFELYDRWYQDSRVEFAAEPRGIEPLFRQATLHSVALAAGDSSRSGHLANPNFDSRVTDDLLKSLAEGCSH
jgi:hypothetical protein